jgi:TRAP-type C4-dicarboxylate transport system permease small subunit
VTGGRRLARIWRHTFFLTNSKARTMSGSQQGRRRGPGGAGTWGSMLAIVADRAVEAAAAVLMLAMLAVVVLGVGCRMANQPLVWTDELAQYLLVWLGFLGWVIASRRQSHIRITVLLVRLPRLLRVGLEIAIQLAIVLLALILIWQAGPLIRRNIDVEAVTLPFPSAMLYVLLPVLAIVLVAQAAKEIRGVLRYGDVSRSDPGAGAL